MKAYPTIVLLLLAFSACDGADPAPNPAPDVVAVRVENASPLNFTAVTVAFPDGTERFGGIAAGRASPYREVEMAYRYGAITVVAGGRTYSLVPTDFVGEEPLSAGRYTFVLDVEGTNLLQDVRED